MSQRMNWSGKAIGLLFACVFVLGALFAFLGVGTVPARAATCDVSGSVISGVWTVTTAQVCSGIFYTVDGYINIGAGGSLTILNGGLSFAKDAMHTGYALNVTGGGTLILDGSILTTQTGAIQPYLYLALTVSSSTLTMRNGAIMKFPGWFNATGATITMSGSTITGFTPAELSGVGVYTGANDNSPIITWSSTNAYMYQSAIARIYENTSAAGAGANVSGPAESNVSLLSSSHLYAYDSYIGVDFSNVYGLHNELQVDGNSNAFLYNVTIDRTQDPVSETQWQPAYRPTVAGGAIYLLRWAHVNVVDSTGFPVSGTTIWSVLSPVQQTATYPDNSNLPTPSTATLNYLGRTSTGATAWNTTDANGNAVIPLYTDVITTSSLPNAVSFGSYQLVVTYTGTTTVQTQGGVSFFPYPAIAWTDNNKFVTVPFSNLQIRTGADLALKQSDYPGTVSVIVNQKFTITATIYNQGQTAASNFAIAAYLDGNLSNRLAIVNGLSLAALSQMDQNLTINGISSINTHTVELIVDPANSVPEGGIAQESNNFANVTYDVGPPPSGFVAILGPDNGATVVPGTTLTVTGYVRQPNLNAISGVQLTVDLRLGGTTILTNSTQSQSDGFFFVNLAIPSNAATGTYTVVVTPNVNVITSDSRTITIASPVPFISSPVPVLGIPWWMFLLIVAAIVVAFVAVTMYFRVYGLGKMVECGECGAFIPEDATRCPKCGVEFEKDMAKCSNCQAWIPTDVKTCPECGVEFATGELDMTDYQEKMRLQYDEVVQRFHKDAQNQLGRALSNQEFQEWWRKQPTFLTFEDWLHEEEDMRKMGSKPCPVCGTLNSVTAKVCHKCGSMMAPGQARAPTGATKVMAPKAKPVRAPAAEEGAEDTGQPRPPTASPVIVQKKVVKRPPVEGEQQGDAGTQDETKGDEL